MDRTVPHQLDYAPPAKRRIFTTRRLFWLSVSLMAAFAICFVWKVYVPEIRSRVESVRLRSKAMQACLAHTMPTTQSAFDESTQKEPCRLENTNPLFELCRQNRTDAPLPADQLWEAASARGTVYHRYNYHYNWLGVGWGSVSPTCWSNFLDQNLSVAQGGIDRICCASGLRQIVHDQSVEYVNGDYRSVPRYGPLLTSLAYLGPLTTPSGEQRLIHLSFDSPAFVWGAKKPFRVVSYPTHWSLSAYKPVESDSSAGLDYSDLRPFKLFPAQRDPNDHSHLSMVYQFGPDTGTIDARLDNSGQVILSRRR